MSNEVDAGGDKNSPLCKECGHDKFNLSDGTCRYYEEGWPTICGHCCEDKNSGADAGPVLSANEESKTVTPPLATPEQIVYGVAQRDPGFRRHLIEQLTALGDEQDRGPLKVFPPSSEYQRGLLEAAEIAEQAAKQFCKTAFGDEKALTHSRNDYWQRVKGAQSVWKAIRSRISEPKLVTEHAEVKLQKIREIADLGSALELDDAQDRLEAIVKIAG